MTNLRLVTNSIHNAKNKANKKHINWKRIAKKAKNPILILLCIAAVVAMVFGAGYIQQELYKKGILLFLVGYAWLWLFLKANPDLCWTEDCCERCCNRHCDCCYDDNDDYEE